MLIQCDMPIVGIRKCVHTQHNGGQSETTLCNNQLETERNDSIMNFEQEANVHARMEVAVLRHTAFVNRSEPLVSAPQEEVSKADVPTEEAAMRESDEAVQSDKAMAELDSQCGCGSIGERIGTVSSSPSPRAWSKVWRYWARWAQSMNTRCSSRWSSKT